MENFFADIGSSGPVLKITTPIGGHEVEISEMTVGDRMDTAASVSIAKYEFHQHDAYVKSMDKNVSCKVKYKDMADIDVTYILMMNRIFNMGNDFGFAITCTNEECGHHNSIKFSLSDDKINEMFDECKNILSEENMLIDDDKSGLKAMYNPPTYGDIFEINQRLENFASSFLNMDISNEEEKNRIKNFLVGMSCISKLIKPDDSELDLSEMSMEQRLRILKNCPYSVINRIAEDINAKNAEIILTFVETHKINCSNCNTELVSILKFLDRDFFVK